MTTIVGPKLAEKLIAHGAKERERRKSANLPDPNAADVKFDVLSKHIRLFEAKRKRGALDPVEQRRLLTMTGQRRRVLEDIRRVNKAKFEELVGKLHDEEGEKSG